MYTIGHQQELSTLRYLHIDHSGYSLGGEDIRTIMN